MALCNGIETNLDQIRRLLITGSGGRLGRLLRAAAGLCGRDGPDVIFQSRKPDADICWSPGDPFEKLPDCDMVVALWGRTDGDERALSENSDLARLSRDVAHHCGARHVVHMSSAAVYGPGEDFTEDAPLAPVTAYGAAKSQMERKLLETARADGPRDIILRLANVVGADSLAPALKGKSPVVLDRFEDGLGPHRSYLAPGDLFQVLLHLAQAEDEAVPGVLNVASVASVGMEDLARAAGKEIVWRPAPDTAVQNVTLDISKLIAAFPDMQRQQTAADLIADWRALEAMR